MVALRVVVVGVGVEVSPALVAKMHENQVQMSCVCWSRQARIFGVCGPGLVGAATAEGGSLVKSPRVAQGKLWYASLLTLRPTVAGLVKLGKGPDQSGIQSKLLLLLQAQEAGGKTKKILCGLI